MEERVFRASDFTPTKVITVKRNGKETHIHVKNNNWIIITSPKSKISVPIRGNLHVTLNCIYQFDNGGRKEILTMDIQPGEKGEVNFNSPGVTINFQNGAKIGSFSNANNAVITNRGNTTFNF